MSKTLLAFFTLGSLVGVISAPAVGEEIGGPITYDLTVTVTDGSAPACVETYSIASWNPGLIGINFLVDEIDLASPTTALDFDVTLNFEDGVDTGDCVPAGDNREPTGNVTAEFSVLPNELVSTVNCNPPGYCTAADLSNEAVGGGTIEGTLRLKETSTPGTYFAVDGGSYLATLRVIWTPEGD
jgi:hypothetical protein